MVMCQSMQVGELAPPLIWSMDVISHVVCWSYVHVSSLHIHVGMSLPRCLTDHVLFAWLGVVRSVPSMRLWRRLRCSHMRLLVGTKRWSVCVY